MGLLETSALVGLVLRLLAFAKRERSSGLHYPLNSDFGPKSEAREEAQEEAEPAEFNSVQ